MRGSAAGTLVAEALGVLAGLFIAWRMYGDLFSDRAQTDFRPREDRPDVRDQSRHFDPQHGAAFAFAFFTAQGARGGDIMLAANAILLNLFLVAAYLPRRLRDRGRAVVRAIAWRAGRKEFSRVRALDGFVVLHFCRWLAMAALLCGNAFIEFLTTNPQVRAYARDYLVFAALMPLAGALAFEFDGVFVGATWTRDMRNMMLFSLALYIASFYLLRPLGNSGLWLALLVFLLARGFSLAWRYRKLSALSFPLAQSAAAAPVASASRG